MRVFGFCTSSFEMKSFAWWGGGQGGREGVRRGRIGRRARRRWEGMQRGREGVGCVEGGRGWEEGSRVGGVAHLGRDGIPRVALEGVLAAQDLRLLLLVVPPHEGQVATEHEEDDHADAPQVALRVVRPSEHFGRHVRRGAAALVDEVTRLDNHRQPEVDDLERRARLLVLVQQVLGLEVAMDDVLRVDVAHGVQHVDDRERGLALGQPLLRDAVEELAARARLHHDVPKPLVLGRVEDVADVVVALDLLHDGDLVVEVVPLLLLLEAHRLERAILPRLPVLGQMDRAEAALAQRILADVPPLLQALKFVVARSDGRLAPATHLRRRERPLRRLGWLR